MVQVLESQVAERDLLHGSEFDQNCGVSGRCREVAGQQWFWPGAGCNLCVDKANA